MPERDYLGAAERRKYPYVGEGEVLNGSLGFPPLPPELPRLLHLVLYSALQYEVKWEDLSNVQEVNRSLSLLPSFPPSRAPAGEWSTSCNLEFELPYLT